MRERPLQKGTMDERCAGIAIAVVLAILLAILVVIKVLICPYAHCHDQYVHDGAAVEAVGGALQSFFLELRIRAAQPLRNSEA